LKRDEKYCDTAFYYVDKVGLDVKVISIRMNKYEAISDLQMFVGVRCE